MPKSSYRRRGGVVRYRTVRTRHGKGYFRVAVVSRAGKRGGHTEAGRIRTYKQAHRRRRI